MGAGPAASASESLLQGPCPFECTSAREMQLYAAARKRACVVLNGKPRHADGPAENELQSYRGRQTLTERALASSGTVCINRFEVFETGLRLAGVNCADVDHLRGHGGGAD